MIKLVSCNPLYAELLYKWRQEEGCLKYNPIKPISFDDFYIKIKNTSSNLSALDENKEFRFFVQYKDDIVGSVAIDNINLMMLYCEISYIIGEKFQKRGFGTGSVKLLIAKIFVETNIRKISSYVAINNFASQKVMSKTGFVQEGICRQHYIVNGKPTDEILYSILKLEYIKNKSLYPNKKYF